MEPGSVSDIVQLMANFINYLNVSLYEGSFTYNHEQARVKLNEIYDCVSRTPSEPPSLEHSIDFYNNVHYLINVTYTDDPDYHTYKRNLKTYINMLKKNS